MDHRLGFGVFLAPHHPIGEHPTLQLQRDLELARLLDKLAYDEFWVGEHHSGGWETIASPEMFLVSRPSVLRESGLAPAWFRCRTIIRSPSRSESSCSTI